MVCTGLQFLYIELCPKYLKFTGVDIILTEKICDILNISLKQKSRES